VNDLNSNEFVELVTGFLDGGLDAEAERRFVDHLALCEGCDRYLDQLRRTIRGLGDLPAEGRPDGARDALLNAFRGWSR
jgi:anti-sigma factor RsiW